MAELPTGTVTFLFTDLERSTRLWEEQPSAMQAALARHDDLLAEAFARHRGEVVKSTGDGLHAVFRTADAAVAAAVDGQRAVRYEEWGLTGALCVRMAMNTGVAEQRGADYFGPVLNRVARLLEITQPGQLLCSQATADLAREGLPEGVELVDLGRHRLRDLERPEVVFQVQHPELPADFPPLPSLDAFPGNLPTERTSLVGRSSELARLATLLEEHRLVTLTGVGGVGKTRLAVQLAADVVDRYPDGAWLVALGSIRDPQLVPATVAAALGIPERPPRPMMDVICDAIGSRELLVVLDNCEHLLDATARLVDALLDSCPAMRIAATSREALGVDGEQGWPTPSLGIPPANATDVGDAEAVRLFVDRARAVRPDFELSEKNARAVADISRRLDGIPLAIELAAARVNALAPPDILERIDQRFVLLTGGSRTAMERHQTLRAAVDWSYDLLDEGERGLFDRISVFAGGFTIDAAVAVAANPDATDVEVLDLLSGLVAKSMVMADGSGQSVRYSLLETLRQYGRERLAADGDVTPVRDRHANYYTELGASLRDRIVSPEQGVVAEQLATEFDNRRTAFDWWVERGEPRRALGIAMAYGGTGSTTSGETLRRFEVALALAKALPPDEQVEPLGMAAWIAASGGSFDRAVELAAASNACAQEAAAPPHSLAYDGLALAAFWQGNPAAAAEASERSVELAEVASDGSGRRQARVIGALGQQCFILAQIGETDRSLAAGEKAVAHARRLGAPSLLRMALHHLGLAYRTVDVERAERLLEESTRVPVVIMFGTAMNSWVHVGIAQLRTATRDDEGARAAYGTALEQCRRTGEHFVLPTILNGLAYLERRQDHLEDATRLLAAADGVAARFAVAGGLDAANRSRVESRLRQLLGDERFESAWASTHHISFDEGVTLGLQAAGAHDEAGSSKPPQRI